MNSRTSYSMMDLLLICHFPFKSTNKHQMCFKSKFLYGIWYGSIAFFLAFNGPYTIIVIPFEIIVGLCLVEKMAEIRHQSVFGRMYCALFVMDFSLLYHKRSQLVGCFDSYYWSHKQQAACNFSIIRRNELFVEKEKNKWNLCRWQMTFLSWIKCIFFAVTQV